MKKNMSSYQLAANQRNGSFSTGPKSPNGKSVSKMNALKYGIRAKDVLVRGYSIKESPRDYKNLCRQFYEHYAPTDPVEEMLVDEIVDLNWRLRRIKKAETAEIALQVDGGIFSRHKGDPLGFIYDELARAALVPELRDQVLFHFESKLKQTSVGIDWIMVHLKVVLEGIETDRELTEANLSRIKGRIGSASLITLKLHKFREEFLQNPGNLDEPSLNTQHVNQVTKYLNDQLNELDILLRERKAYEGCEERARQQADLVPSKDKFESILRYGTSLQKKLYRAMHELERLQRRKLGEHVPAPQVLEISNGS